MANIVDYILEEDYPRYQELVTKAAENKANAPKVKKKRAPLTKEQKIERMKKQREALNAKLEALINGEAEVNFAEGSKVTVQDTSGKELDAIYIENADANPVEINGAENAGLVQDEDGNFVTEDKAETTDPTPETPGDPEQKPSGNDGGQKPDDMNGQASGGKEETASPKTGDSSVLLLALGALAGSGAAAGAVLRKKRGMTE